MKMGSLQIDLVDRWKNRHCTCQLFWCKDIKHVHTCIRHNHLGHGLLEFFEIPCVHYFYLFFFCPLMWIFLSFDSSSVLVFDVFVSLSGVLYAFMFAFGGLFILQKSHRLQCSPLTKHT